MERLCTGIVSGGKRLRRTGGQELFKVGRLLRWCSFPEKRLAGVLQMKTGEGIGKDHEDLDDVLRRFLLFERSKRIRRHYSEQRSP